jgi:hypothetical protein
MSSIKNKINKLLFEKIETDFHNDNKLVDALHLLLNGNFIKYDFENVNISLSNLKSDDFQTEMFKLNEKSSKRKKNGVYYTPNDVSEYIIANSFINFIDNSINKTINYNEIYNTLINYDNEKLNKILFNSKILDPTCGSGEFLLNTFIMKYNLLKETKNVDDENILKITKTLYGNDIDDESTDISKIRLFMYVYSLLENKDYYKKLTKILINNFTNYDFVLDSNKINNKFEIVVGNPPYVEYGKYDGKEKLINKYGNIYADVIKNSIDLLKCGGILGFIVPLSYVATTRMSKIREYVTEKCSKQILLSFADRPDCLFSGVHQKLNIVIFQKNYNKNKNIYVSNYKHWYKEERKELLNGRDVMISNYNLNFIPKIGNNIEKSIFDKIFTTNKENLYDIQSQSGERLYLNMRSCFWIKAFSFNPGSSEYKEFKYENVDYVICLLNSSLFWLYWTMISDCWHITSKELKHFRFIDTTNDFKELRKKLEQELEKTKKYVGSKQTEYEYKHKFCKKIIDKIDDKLANIYGLNSMELDYLKNFAIKYRMGGFEDEN